MKKKKRKRTNASAHLVWSKSKIREGVQTEPEKICETEEF